MLRRSEMEVDMEGVMDLGLSGCSSGAMGGDLLWGDWSPAMDYGQLFDAGEFHGLLDHYGLLCSTGLDDWSASVSATSTVCPGTPMYEALPMGGNAAGAAGGDDDQGLRLVHLLMAGAEALTGANKSRDLARVILARLKELLAGGGASSMERVAEYFTDALQGLVDGSRQVEEPPNHLGEVTEAFQLLQDMSPYFKFGHFTANQAILEAVAGERRVHVVDYEVMEGVQWASLMQALVSRRDGLPPPHLRITAVIRCGSGRRSTATVLETGRRLAAFAASLNLPFSFGHCRLDVDEKFRPEAVKLVKGEVVVFNCALYPPHHQWHSAASIASFLSGAGALKSRVVTVVEETSTYADDSGGSGGEFVGLFMEELRRYSAMWDSLEAGFPLQGKSRGMVERKILGTMIAGAVGRAYRRQENREEKMERWAEWMEMAGFRRAGLSFFNLCQSRLLLGLFNEGYRVEEEAPNKLVFSWKTCRLLSASVWSAPALGSPAARSFSG